MTLLLVRCDTAHCSKLRSALSWRSRQYARCYGQPGFHYYGNIDLGASRGAECMSTGILGLVASQCVPDAHMPDMQVMLE